MIFKPKLLHGTCMIVPGQCLDIRSHYQKPAEVLCVDARRQTVEPDVSLVDVRIGVDNSPVKIVCHSPSRINHSRYFARWICVLLI